MAPEPDAERARATPSAVAIRPPMDAVLPRFAYALLIAELVGLAILEWRRLALLHLTLIAQAAALLLFFVTSRYRQIERLAKAFNDFETKNGTAFIQLEDYLSAINRFFTDSKKELYFNDKYAL